MKVKCPFWKVCGPAPIQQLLARREFPDGDPKQNYVAMVCNGKNEYAVCEHYKIRQILLIWFVMIKIIRDGSIIRLKPNQRRWRKMLGDIWGDFCFWLKRKKPGVITFLVQLAVWIVGGVVIIFLTAKEFYERRAEQWKKLLF